MSDRRFLLVLIGVLAGLLGSGVAVLAVLPFLLDPAPPTAGSGELGVPADVTRELIAAIVLGLLLAVAGAGTAVALVRAQLKR